MAAGLLGPASEVCEAGSRGRHLHNLPVPLRFLSGPIAIVATLVGGGCGSGEPPVEDRLTACEVLTAREVAAAVGRAVSTPPASSDAATDQLAGRSGCAWSSEDGKVAVLVELVRTQDMARSVRRTGFSAAARFRAAETEHPEADGGPTVGDRSLFVEEESELWMLVDDSLVVFEVAVTPTSAARDIAEALASRARPRLERADS